MKFQSGQYIFPRYEFRNEYWAGLMGSPAWQQP
jgi:hypothetical protein